MTDTNKSKRGKRGSVIKDFRASRSTASPTDSAAARTQSFAEHLGSTLRSKAGVICLSAATSLLALWTILVSALTGSWWLTAMPVLFLMTWRLLSRYLPGGGSTFGTGRTRTSQSGTQRAGGPRLTYGQWEALSQRRRPVIPTAPSTRTYPVRSRGSHQSSWTPSQNARRELDALQSRLYPRTPTPSSPLLPKHLSDRLAKLLRERETTTSSE
jgi:hypothetical protein